jgi:hypothetical protein
MTEINRFSLIVAAILAVLMYVASTTLNTESIATTAIPTNNSLSETNNTNLTSTNYCFTIPILPGGIELMKKWNEENIVNKKEHDAVFMTAGITHEQVWIQHMPQQQYKDFAIACYETSDPEQSFKVLATSDEPWAVKFREHLKNAHGLDIAQTSIKLNELLIDWKK